MSELTTRETIATTLNDSLVLRELGLPENAVLQADTVSSPEATPFIVIRWMDENSGIGDFTRRPFTLWLYDNEEDYSRIETIGYTAAQILTSMVGVPTRTGHISQIEGRPTTNNPGLGRGPDLYDEGYKCVVIPWRLQAIARGL